MHQHSRRQSLYVLLLVATLSACGGRAAHPTPDQLLNEVNVLLSEEEQSVNAVPMKYQNAFGRDGLLRAFADRESLRRPVTEMISYLNASSARYHDIANKFDQISQLPIDQRAKEYAAAQARLFAKDAEYRTVSKDRISLVLDESIKDAETFSAKLDKADELIKQVQVERARLQARSDAFAERSQLAR